METRSILPPLRHTTVPDLNRVFLVAGSTVLSSTMRIPDSSGLLPPNRLPMWWLPGVANVVSFSRMSPTVSTLLVPASSARAKSMPK